MDLGSGELDQLLSQSRKMLESLRSQRSDAQADLDMRGTGEAADGKVRAVAAAGRVTELELDPRVMRMASAELASHIRAAVNAALDDLAAQVPTADGEYSAVDTRALAAQVAEIQEQGVRQMAALGQAISAAIRRIQERA